MADHFAAVDLWLADLELEQLALGWRLNELTLELVGSTDQTFANILEFRHVFCHYNLERRLTTTIVELNEGQLFALLTTGA